MFHLPPEMIRHIYAFDATKDILMDKVCHQLKMRQVWYELLNKSGSFEVHFMNFDNMMYGKNSVDDREYTYYRTEDEFEESVRKNCIWNRVHGRKSRSPFLDLGLMIRYYQIFKHHLDY